MRTRIFFIHGNEKIDRGRHFSWEANGSEEKSLMNTYFNINLHMWSKIGRKEHFSAKKIFMCVRSERILKILYLNIKSLHITDTFI